MLEIKHNSKGLVSHGLSTCAGCGLELIFRKVMEVLGEDTIILNPPGCVAMFAGNNQVTGVKVPGFQGNLENTAACAAGVRGALDAMGNKTTTVLAFAGDGGTVDIGLQSLSGVMERQDKVLYICYDNEAYMNTGIQGSSSTPLMASTTTTPYGKPTGRKDLIQIAIAHDVPYAATASIHNLPDLKSKVEKAKAVDGPSIVHIQTPCPTGWRYPPAKSIELARKAVQCGCWILYEYENGKIKINHKPKELIPVSEYVGIQKRFGKLTDEDLLVLQAHTTAQYEKTIKRLESMT